MKYYGHFRHDLDNKKIEVFTEEEYESKYRPIKNTYTVYTANEYFDSYESAPYSITASSKEEVKHILRDVIENICRTSAHIYPCSAEDMRSFLKNEIEDLDNIKVIDALSIGNEYSRNCACMPKEANIRKYLYDDKIYLIPDFVNIDKNHPKKFSIDWYDATIEDYINLTDKSDIREYTKLMYWHKRERTESLSKCNKLLEELQEKIKSINNDLDLLEGAIKEIPDEIKLPFELNVE